jgi:hypothetical protein
MYYKDSDIKSSNNAQLNEIYYYAYTIGTMHKSQTNIYINIPKNK